MGAKWVDGWKGARWMDCWIDGWMVGREMDDGWVEGQITDGWVDMRREFLMCLGGCWAPTYSLSAISFSQRLAVELIWRQW